LDRSGVIVGGITGAVIVLVVFAIIMIPQPNAIKPEIVVTNGHDLSAIGEIVPSYSKKLSLIEIFENSEAGVVRVNIQRSEESNSPGGVGSGFVFDKKGHIITNAHVVEDAIKVVVTFLDGRSYNAEIVGVDTFTDIAVIKVNADLSLLSPIFL
jgi:S1-C subfamily serine protease